MSRAKKPRTGSWRIKEVDIMSYIDVLKNAPQIMTPPAPPPVRAAAVSSSHAR